MSLISCRNRRVSASNRYSESIIHIVRRCLRCYLCSRLHLQRLESRLQLPESGRRWKGFDPARQCVPALLFECAFLVFLLISVRGIKLYVDRHLASDYRCPDGRIGYLSECSTAPVKQALSSPKKRHPIHMRRSKRHHPEI